MGTGRILAVAQAFKETLGVEAVARAYEAGIRAAGLEPDVIRASDGGDGLLDALGSDLARRTTHRATGPLGRPVTVGVGWLDDGTAVVESRLVCGLSLVDAGERNPLVATSRGLGELIGALAGTGASRVLVGLGGSATVDGGLGMARAWGWVPLDAGGTALPEGGGALPRLDRLRPGHAPAAALVGLADVRNPLIGPRGAWVYAAQKGARPEAVEQLARGLERLAALARAEGWADLARQPGAGAAGGLGFGLRFFGGGTLLSGARWMLERQSARARVAGARLVLTGEGAFDRTSLEGKLVGEVLALARDGGVSAAVVAPRSADGPHGVLVESGGGLWTEGELARRVRAAVERAIRTVPGS